MRFVFQIVSVKLVLLPMSLALAEDPQGDRWPFFAFDNGVGRDLGWSAGEQASVLAGLGYQGIGLTGLGDFENRLEEFESAGLRVFSCYVPCRPGKDEALLRRISEVGAAMARAGAVLWVYVPATSKPESTVIEAVREIADRADAVGVRVVLYPHHNFYVETTRDALRVADAVDRDNVGVALNLCHELRAGVTDLERAIGEAGDRLWLVSINGADPPHPEARWGELIKPLGQGGFPVGQLLRKLREAGYRGPIGLQCYRIAGEPRQLLAESMSAWSDGVAESSEADRAER